MALKYIGTVAFRQVTPPAWDKSYAGEPDKCTLVFQGAQYLEKTFLNNLTKYQTMQTIAGLTVSDEQGNNVGDANMFLTKFTSDDSAIFPKVTLTFVGCRGGTAQDALIKDDVVIQGATTSHTVTGSGLPQNGNTITMAIQYRVARSSFEWVALSDPAGNASPYNTVNNPLTYSLATAPNIMHTICTGMKDTLGDPTNTIDTGSETEVWNSFASQVLVNGPSSDQIVPGKVWKCSSTVDWVLIGT